MDFTDIGFLALQVVLPVFVAALTWAAGKLATLIQSKVDNEYLRGMLVRLDTAVITAIKDLQQSVVDELKAASADGKLTDQEKNNVKNIAVANVKSYLGPKGVEILSEILGLSNEALDRYFRSKVEAAVHDLRLAAPFPTVAAVGERTTA